MMHKNLLYDAYVCNKLHLTAPAAENVTLQVCLHLLQALVCLKLISSVHFNSFFSQKFD